MKVLPSFNDHARIYVHVLRCKLIIDEDFLSGQFWLMIIIYDILWYIQKLSTKKIEIPSTALNR